MEQIEVKDINTGTVSLPYDNTKTGTYYQMRVSDQYGYDRFVNLLLDCFGKWISAVDIQDKLVFRFIDEDLMVDNIHVGDRIEVETRKDDNIANYIALKIYP